VTSGGGGSRSEEERERERGGANWLLPPLAVTLPLGDGKPCAPPSERKVRVICPPPQPPPTATGASSYPHRLANSINKY
jgi:hypothetical protein